jgi:hypothetical protein
MPFVAEGLSEEPMNRLTAGALIVLVAPMVAGMRVQATSPEPTLDEVRAATEKYKDVRVAERDGYIRDPMGHCVTSTAIGYPASAGAMGVHYMRKDLLGIADPPNPRVNGTGTHTDFRTPALLLYEPQKDGSLELVGVENMVFERAWLANHKVRPSFQGMPYERMADDPSTPVDEAHKFMPHFDRHVWLYRANPTGIFSPFNPNVTCTYFRDDTPAHRAH